ncbi:MAG: alpha/beta fold hydrolase [Pseudoxanthomonas sp.]
MPTGKQAAILKGAVLFFLLIGVLGTAFSYWVGGQLVAPRPAAIGLPPADLHAQSVDIATDSGVIRGWWINGDPVKGAVLLLHGIRANRLAMVGRARLLSRHGYSVLLVDLQAHGESPGDAITLGLRESTGVQAARAWIKLRHPGRPVAAIGVSLGGASILLGPSPVGFDAVVLEAVYPDARQALQNRMAMRFGGAAPLLSKLLEMQVRPRLGVSLEKLRPIDHIAGIGAPVMIVAGGRDQHTTPAESRALYARARAPKELLILPDAAHQDFERHSPSIYEKHVITFLDQALHAPCLDPNANCGMSSQL